MMSDCRGAMSSVRPKSRSGGLETSSLAGAAFSKGRRPRFSKSGGRPAMTALRLIEHPYHTDHLRLRNGKTLTVRFVAPDDAETLQRYFRLLSVRSRYNRFLGAVSELPPRELDRFTHAGEDE